MISFKLGYSILLAIYRTAQEQGKLSPEVLRDFFEQSESAKSLFPGLAPAQIRSVEPNSPDTIDVLFEDTSPITLEITSEQGYQKFIDQYKEAKKRETLDQDLREIVEKFSREYQKGILVKTLSLENFTSASDSEDSLYFSFAVPFSPWIQLQFLDSGVSVRGGPFIYDFLLEDDVPDHEFPSFYQPRELDLVLSELAESNPNIRKQTQVQEETPEVKEGLVIRPAKFPDSSATKTSKYFSPPRDFEIREEVVPVTALSCVLSYLRNNQQITAKPQLESAVKYSDPVLFTVFQNT